MEHPKRKGKTYDVWQGETRIASRREQICKAIDAALPKTFLELLEMLRQMGYEIREHGEPALRGRDQKRFIRMDTLGEGYSVEILKTVIAGTRKHQTYSRTKTQQISLLIDVQAKLAEGKGIGCANWASRYNINQTARALSYLKEHGLLRYSTHPQIKENVKNGFVVGRYQQQF